MLGLMCGNIGEGKTIFLVYLCWKLHCWNLQVAEKYRVPIFTNFMLKYPEARSIGVSDLLQAGGLKSGFMVLQEAYTWMESRASSSLLNRYVSYFIFQSRKRNVDVFADAQLGSTIDLRLYELAHIIGLARKDMPNRVFTYQFAIRSGLGIRLVKVKLPMLIASMFWDDYNTDEPAPPLGVEELQFQMDKYSPVKINVRVDDMVSKLLGEGKYSNAVYYVNNVPHKFAEIPYRLGWDNPKAVYKYQVEDTLLRLGEPLPLAPLVTNRLKVVLRERG